MAGKKKKETVSIRPGQKIPSDRCEEMFDYYCQTESISKVASKFNHSRSSVTRIMKRDNWKDRQIKNRERLQQKHDTKIVQKIASNLELAGAVKKKLLIEILKKETKLDPSIKDLIAVMRYEDELLGNVRPETSAVNILQILQNMNEREQDELNDDANKIIGKLRSENRL